MAFWLVTLAWAAEPLVGPEPGLDAWLRSALWVVDAYVVRTVSYDLMGIVWTSDRRPPGTNREIRYCVHWDRPPVGEDDAVVVSEEWVVVDVSGRPLTVERFASLTGRSAHAPRPHGAMLGGTQLGFGRREVENAIALRTAATRVGIPARTQDAVRRQVVASMERPPCTEALPTPISGG